MSSILHLIFIFLHAILLQKKENAEINTVYIHFITIYVMMRLYKCTLLNDNDYIDFVRLCYCRMIKQYLSSDNSSLTE
ncbi:hypothetical protein BDF20DRAFT_899609 [Mycotypha africana]|uniref:uncharacterized protein n=1 Tax=Mycotypha africana TaxID=64632 RepID=UPI002301ADD8|nr:uncharacterized protein BDF20DRAFT_899609 [Mycotypha africana]KAI8967503.1 hypothetical protein BDF20DRAFT_899609 [Mycotypha africana]